MLSLASANLTLFLLSSAPACSAFTPEDVNNYFAWLLLSGVMASRISMCVGSCCVTCYVTVRFFLTRRTLRALGVTLIGSSDRFPSSLLTLSEIGVCALIVAVFVAVAVIILPLSLTGLFVLLVVKFASTMLCSDLARSWRSYCYNSRIRCWQTSMSSTALFIAISNASRCACSYNYNYATFIPGSCTRDMYDEIDASITDGYEGREVFFLVLLPSLLVILCDDDDDEEEEGASVPFYVACATTNKFFFNCALSFCKMSFIFCNEFARST